ncbi:MAG TPA: hypothetical protein PLS69_05465 [Terricaulis sp.]|nr:hypothetical protein [Terricaulis sp.]
MPMTIEEFMQTEAGQQMQIDNAGLSDMEQSNLMAALQKAEAEGSLESFNADNAILEAQWAEEARAEAEAFQAEQAKAAEEGDWEKAREMAENAEYAMEEVKEHGGDVADAEILEAQYDQMELENADYHQEIADDNADAAAAYAAEGDLETAEIYADSAAEHAETAADYGSMADQGGTYAEQTVDTSSSYDATASIDTVDTTAE